MDSFRASDATAQTLFMRPRLAVVVVLRSLRRRPVTWLALTLGTLVLLAAVTGPLVAPFPPDQQDITDRLRPPLSRADGGRLHLFGTDALGRDVWSRILISARLTIPISLSAVGLSAVVGGLLGTVATFRGGWLESIVMRVADVQMAFPAILLSLGIVAILGASLGNLIFVLALSGWVLYARVSRSQVLTLKRLDFVEAARASGASEWYILRRHIASNVLPTLLVMTTYLLGGVVTGESALSFLGLGVQPPSFTWGGMLSEGTAYMMVAWWLATFPGIAIMLTVFSATAIGEWLRDYFDPRLRME